MHRSIAGSLVLLLVGPAAALAQARADTAARSRPSAIAARRSGPVHVDGRLDEDAWEAAAPATGFTQQEPHEGESATQATRVRFLYDADALYVGARMTDAKAPSGVTARLARRDDDPMSDGLRIDLDLYHDRLHHVRFSVDPAGWRGDSDDGDDSWDPVWEAATSVDSGGWTAEIRIPFSQLQFSSDSVQTWGLELTRIVHRTQEKDLWSFYGLDEAGGPSFYGTLRGIRLAGAPVHAEVLPYVTTRAQRLGTGDPKSPFYDPNPARLRFGGSFKYLLNSSFTLSGTVNPDFGQVEVDPAVVNLSAFETYYSEKRPFFVQGAGVFDFGSPGCQINCRGMSLFYSRRIGAAPPGAGLAEDEGVWADVPDNTTILGAGKLTGRTSGGTTVGVLDAVTGRETARAARADSTVFDQPVAPLTNDFVGRVKQDLDGGNLVLGGLFTSVDRRLDDPGLADLLPGSSKVGGADVQYYWDQHDYSLYASFAASHVTGDSAAILGLQRSSARYFQRPDRTTTGDGLFSAGYRPGATALNGYGFRFRLSKESGDWLGDVNAAAMSPGFEVNDLGYQRQTDYLWLNGSLIRQLTRPTAWYRSLVFGAGAERYWNYDGDITTTDVTGAAIWQLLDYWQLKAIYQHTFAALDDRATRGGPLVRRPGSDIESLQVTTDPRQAVTVDATGTLTQIARGGFERSLEASVTWRPSPNLSVSLGPSYTHTVSPDQYVSAVADSTATAFYGHRYVFSHLDEKQLAMETRVNVTFTPSLTFELYVQPLLASADFSKFEEFAAPRREKKLVYGKDIGTIAPIYEIGSGGGAGRGGLAGGGASMVTGYTIDPDGSGPASSFQLGNPNFDRRSLRGTAVLRWEWR
ncbi:MAG TPA: DUF5916 domain-containing protein, partial [Gemmatimonadota bacterium]|nr:DUF5916 domain-containing protein [Gemmatimonadota bacterium]